MLFAMSLFNLIGVYVLLPVVKRELKSYLDHVKAVDAGSEKGGSGSSGKETAPEQ